MKKVSTIFLVLFLLAFTASAQVKTEMDVALGKFQQYYNAKSFELIYDLLSARSQQMMDKPKTKSAMEGLYNSVGNLKTLTFQRKEDKIYYYKADFNASSLILFASLSDDNKLDVFRFMPDKKEASATEISQPVKGASDYALKTPTGTIHGTLTVPDTTGKFPVVLIIAGSGPTDRDGNNSGMRNNAYKMIAAALQAEGIASLRYDKRGVGGSAASLTNEMSIVFEDYVNDAAGYIDMLKKDTRFSSVIVLGHSEGSLIGMLAAQQGNVAKYISVAGAGESIDKVLLAQLSAQSQEMAINAASIMDSIKKGFLVKHLANQAMQSLFRPSVQPYMRSWMKYDPAKELAKLKIPVLLVQGENDLQVSMKHVNNLKLAYPSAQLQIHKQMNHIMKNTSAVRDNNLAAYDDPNLPLSREFVAGLLKFVKEK